MLSGDVDVEGLIMLVADDPDIMPFEILDDSIIRGSSWNRLKRHYFVKISRPNVLVPDLNDLFVELG
jgi:hypothetical protein